MVNEQKCTFSDARCKPIWWKIILTVNSGSQITRCGSSPRIYNLKNNNKPTNLSFKYNEKSHLFNFNTINLGKRDNLN